MTNNFPLILTLLFFSPSQLNPFFKSFINLMIMSVFGLILTSYDVISALIINPWHSNISVTQQGTNFTARNWFYIKHRRYLLCTWSKKSSADTVFQHQLMRANSCHHSEWVSIIWLHSIKEAIHLYIYKKNMLMPHSWETNLLLPNFPDISVM